MAGIPPAHAVMLSAAVGRDRMMLMCCKWQGQGQPGSEGEALEQPDGREPAEPGPGAVGEPGHLLLHLCDGVLRRW